MYRYQTKHKILSLLLVFSLLILTTVLIFPSPASAQDWDWVWWQSLPPPIDIDPGQLYCTPQVFPNQLDKLILDVFPAFVIIIVDVYLYDHLTLMKQFTLLGDPSGWSSVDPGITVTGTPGHVEVIFDPPWPVTHVCFYNNPVIEPLHIELIQFVESLPNEAPVADADGPYSGNVGSLITFNGSASYDPDEPYGDQIVSWEWEFTGDGKYDDASGEIVQWSWVSPHSGFIGLNVTDTHGAWDTDEAEVNVTPAPTPPPVEVGGEVYPVDRLAILIPGLTLAAILIVGTAVVMRRRRARY